MHHHIFKYSPLKPKNLIQKLLWLEPKENAIIELYNLFSSRKVKTIENKDVKYLEKKYRINFNQTYQKEVSDIYSQYLIACFDDGVLSDEEINDLKNIKQILRITDKEIDQLHYEVALKVYKNNWNEVLKDGVISEIEKDFIKKLENTLKLPSDITESISKQMKENYIDAFLETALDDQRLTPEEEQELKSISESIGVEYNISEQNRNKLEKYKLYWAIENNVLNVLNVDLNLHDYEKCYYLLENINYYTVQSELEGGRYTDVHTKFNAGKEFFMHNNLYILQNIDKERKVLIGNGTIYLTNKRLLFYYNNNTSSIIKLNNIKNVMPYENGVGIKIGNDRKFIFEIKDNADIFALMLERFIVNLNN